MIRVHRSPDLDAVCCLVAAGVDQSGDWGFAGDGEGRQVDVDCEGAEETGGQDSDGRRHAAVCLMPEAAGFDPDLLAEVDEQDTTGRTTRSRFPLPAIWAATKAQALHEGYRGEKLARECVRRMGQVIRGINLLSGRRREATASAPGVRVEDVGRFKVAMLPPRRMTGLNAAMSIRGVACGIFWDKGRALGVTRWPQYGEPDLRQLAVRLPGWYVHPAGFLACWGSNKAPRQEPPTAGTPQDAEQLLALLREVYGG
jgi:hypothetical protein